MGLKNIIFEVKDDYESGIFTFRIRCYQSNWIRLRISQHKEESVHWQLLTWQKLSSWSRRNITYRLFNFAKWHNLFSSTFLIRKYKKSGDKQLTEKLIFLFIYGTTPVDPWMPTLVVSSDKRGRGCCKVATRSPLFDVDPALTLLLGGPNHFTGRSKSFKSTIQDESAATDLLRSPNKVGWPEG